jgi:hypothetical protein
MLEILVAFLITAITFLSIMLLMVRHGLLPSPIRQVETFDNSLDRTQSEMDSIQPEQILSTSEENDPDTINPDQVLIPDQISGFVKFHFTESQKQTVLGVFDYMRLSQLPSEQLGAGG